MHASVVSPLSVLNGREHVHVVPLVADIVHRMPGLSPHAVQSDVTQSSYSAVSETVINPALNVRLSNVPDINSNTHVYSVYSLNENDSNNLRHSSVSPTFPLLMDPTASSRYFEHTRRAAVSVFPSTIDTILDTSFRDIMDQTVDVTMKTETQRIETWQTGETIAEINERRKVFHIDDDVFLIVGQTHPNIANEDLRTTHTWNNVLTSTQPLIKDIGNESISLSSEDVTKQMPVVTPALETNYSTPELKEFINKNNIHSTRIPSPQTRPVKTPVKHINQQPSTVPVYIRPTPTIDSPSAMTKAEFIDIINLKEPIVDLETEGIDWINTFNQPPQVIKVDVNPVQSPTQTITEKLGVFFDKSLDDVEEGSEGPEINNDDTNSFVPDGILNADIIPDLSLEDMVNMTEHATSEGLSKVAEIPPTVQSIVPNFELSKEEYNRMILQFLDHLMGDDMIDPEYVSETSRPKHVRYESDSNMGKSVRRNSNKRVSQSMDGIKGFGNSVLRSRESLLNNPRFITRNHRPYTYYPERHRQTNQNQYPPQTVLNLQQNYRTATNKKLPSIPRAGTHNNAQNWNAMVYYQQREQALHENAINTQHQRTAVNTRSTQYNQLYHNKDDISDDESAQIDDSTRRLQAQLGQNQLDAVPVGFQTNRQHQSPQFARNSYNSPVSYSQRRTYQTWGKVFFICTY